MRKRITILSLLLIIVSGILLLDILPTKKSFAQAFQRVIIYRYDINQWYVKGSATSATTLTITRSGVPGRCQILEGFICGGSVAGYGDLYFGDTWIARVRFPAGETRGWNVILSAPENTDIKLVITLSTTGDCEGTIIGTQK